MKSVLHMLIIAICSDTFYSRCLVKEMDLNFCNHVNSISQRSEYIFVVIQSAVLKC